MAAPDSEGITTASSSEFELRVLGGLQAGARAHLIADGRWITLGRDGDADIVLREALAAQPSLKSIITQNTINKNNNKITSL